MKQRTAQATIHASKKQISTGEGSEAVPGDQMSDAELEQVSGGGLLSSPLPAKLRPPSLTWSGTPYAPVEDVEAY